MSICTVFCVLLANSYCTGLMFGGTVARSTHAMHGWMLRIMHSSGCW